MGTETLYLGVEYSDVDGVSITELDFQSFNILRQNSKSIISLLSRLPINTSKELFACPGVRGVI